MSALGIKLLVAITLNPYQGLKPSAKNCWINLQCRNYLKSLSGIETKI